MDELLFNVDTKRQISSFLSHPAHALIIEGPEGSGKSTLANYLASTLLKIDAINLDKAQFLRIVPTLNSISINEIRSAQQFMRLKTLGRNQFRRVLVVENAGKLTTEAQNAFLKTLEEPPSDTVIILTTDSIASLLPTVRSRVQCLNVNPLTKNQLIEFFLTKGYKAAQIEQTYYQAEGRVGRMQLILGGQPDGQNQQIDFAKRLLLFPLYERLLAINELIANKGQIGQLMQAFDIICQTALEMSASNDDEKQVKRWHKALKALDDAKNCLPHTPNTKLLMANLLLNI